MIKIRILVHLNAYILFFVSIGTPIISFSMKRIITDTIVEEAITDEKSDSFYSFKTLLPELQRTVQQLMVQDAILFLAEEPIELQHTGEVRTIAMRDNTLITGLTDKTIQIWDTNTYQSFHTLEGHTDIISSLAITRDRLLTGSDDTTVKTWDLNTYQTLHTLQAHDAKIESLAIRDDTLVTASWDNTAKIWDMNTWQLLYHLKGHALTIWFVTLDDAIIVTASADRTAKVWDKNTGRLLHTFEEHTSEVWALAMNNDRIATGSADKTVKIWDKSTFHVHKTLHHPDRIYCLAIHNDSIATGAWDGTARVWNIYTGQLLHTFTRHNGIIWSIALNDHIVATGSKDCTVKIWPLAPFKGTTHNNPLLWIMEYATMQRTDFIRRAYQATNDKQDHIISLPEKLGLEKADESQAQKDGRIYFTFPETVRRYLWNKLRITAVEHY